MSLPDTRPLVYLISDGTFDPKTARSIQAFADQMTRAAEAGVDLIQIREKHLTARELFELTAAVVAALDGSRARVLVNSRADVAAAAGADGVHLKSSGLPVSVIRRAFPELIIAVSTHKADELPTARDAGADLAVFGPVFATPGKGSGVGVSGLNEAVKAAAGMPVLALGGITRENYSEAIDAGAAGFAAIRALKDPGWVAEIERENV